MLIFQKQEDLKHHLQSILTSKTSVGFVPTMGALHQGHLSLIIASLKENDITVISIFVNPTQFNNKKDLEKYPRVLKEDIKKLSTVSDKIIIYTPAVNDVYEHKTVAESFDFDGLEFQMEGKHRPGHFDGVGTVVKKLFGIVNPKNAYFGEKDFQQLLIIRKLVQKYNINVTVIEQPIFRETNGLAMSSRNERLTNDQREKASLIFKTLKIAKEKFRTKSANEVNKWAETSFKLQTDLKLDYFQISDEITLLPCIRKNKTKKYRAFIAVFINEIRLIDTISLN